MKIVVDTQEEKDQLIEESKVVHDLVELHGADGFRCGHLAHLYINPDQIEVKFHNGSRRMHKP